MEKWILLSMLITITSSENMTLVSQTRTGYLDKYSNYADTILMHFDIPEDTTMAVFQFRASDMSYSIFGCTTRDVELYLKQGSPPVINPDGSKFPDNTYLSNKPELHYLTLTTDKIYEYINITNPTPGSYFAVAFHPYTNPKDEGITQDGLVPECHSYIDASAYINNDVIEIVQTDNRFKVSLEQNMNLIYKFYVHENIDHVYLNFSNLQFCDKCTKLITKVHTNNIPSNNENTLTQELDLPKNGNYVTKFRVLENSNYYIKFEVENGTENNLGSFDLEIKKIYSIDKISKIVGNNTKMYLNALKKNFYDDSYALRLPFKQYNLHKSVSSESFLYTYEMQPLPDGSVPIAINVTSEDFSVIKFTVKDILDVGGSLQLALSFKPTLVRKGRFLQLKSEPENHTLIACVRNSEKELPIWPNNCKYKETIALSALVLNKTNENESILIPFPEAGDWYLSFKLFCGECLPCECPKTCYQKLEACVNGCESNCTSNACNKCIGDCEAQLITEDGCKSCNCDGGCRRTETTCNTTVLFDVSSYPCVSDGCGSNGKCAFMVSEAFVYSTCVCSNNYKGWNCGDDSDANSLGYIILESLLLILSNVMFVPAVYVGYRRGYYVEALVYFATWFSSSFYHACDAGENVISFCIMRLSVLQFCDFYCALLSIWVTMIALAHVPQPIPPLLHVGGAIILGAGTTLNKTSIWVFVLPVAVGALLILGSWGYKYYKNRVLFPSKRYLKVVLPCGLVVVLIGLLMYSLLQTQSNYKYVHSLWHIFMALAVVILLPNLETFLPDSPAYL